MSETQLQAALAGKITPAMEKVAAIEGKAPKISVSWWLRAR